MIKGTTIYRELKKNANEMCNVYVLDNILFQKAFRKPQCLMLISAMLMYVRTIYYRQEKDADDISIAILQNNSFHEIQIGKTLLSEIMMFD